MPRISDEEFFSKHPSKKEPKRSRGWCFTVQSWSLESFCDIALLFEDDVNCTYLIIGFETAPRTGQEHMQCYIYYTNALSFECMKKKLIGAHIEPQKAKLNVKSYCYCMEDYSYCEWGNRPRQGHRTDLEVIKHDLITKKKTIKDVSKEYFSQYCQYSRQFKSFAEMHNLEPKYDTRLLVYDDSTIKKIYKEYLDELPESFIYENSYYLKSELLHKYYSGKYKNIFIPNCLGVEELDIVDSTLY